jgi:hypothetical protein
LELNYLLDLNEAGEVVGGTWLPNSDRPDFVWMPTKKLEFTGYFSGLESLLNRAEK